MDPLAEQMRSDEPLPAYLDFVAGYVLGGVSERVDPFARRPDPCSGATGVYVKRNDAEKAVFQSGNWVLSGAEGIGKTTLFSRAVASPGCRELPVRALLTTADLDESVLRTRFPVPQTIAAFWRVLREWQNAGLLDKCIELSQGEDSAWFYGLCWFYTNYPPAEGTDPGRRLAEALMARCPDGKRYEQVDELHSLICLVTGFRVPGGGPEQEPAKPYDRIRLLVDGLENLQADAQLHFIESVMAQLGSYKGISLSLSARRPVEARLYLLDSFRQRHLRLHRLPAWTEQDLQKLVCGRLLACTAGGDVMWRDLLDGAGAFRPPDVLRDVPEGKLRPAARKRFMDIVAANAVRAYALHDRVDAPVHALRLARALLTACAGCWQGLGFGLPLSVEKLWKLCDIYWGADAAR